MNELMGRSQGQMAQYQESKELSEIKGKMFLARQFPRDPNYALQAALQECQRKELAEQAMYEFSILVSHVAPSSFTGFLFHHPTGPAVLADPRRRATLIPGEETAAQEP